MEYNSRCTFEVSEYSLHFRPTYLSRSAHDSSEFFDRELDFAPVLTQVIESRYDGSVLGGAGRFQWFATFLKVHYAVSITRIFRRSIYGILTSLLFSSMPTSSKQISTCRWSASYRIPLLVHVTIRLNIRISLRSDSSGPLLPRCLD